MKFILVSTHRNARSNLEKKWSTRQFATGHNVLANVISKIYLRDDFSFSYQPVATSHYLGLSAQWYNAYFFRAGSEVLISPC